MKETEKLLEKKRERIKEIESELETIPQTIEVLKRLLEAEKEKQVHLTNEKDAIKKEYQNLLSDNIKECGHFLFGFEEKIPNHIRQSYIYECENANLLVEKFRFVADSMVTPYSYREIPIEEAEIILKNKVTSAICRFEQVGELYDDIQEDATKEQILSHYTNDYLVFYVDVGNADEDKIGLYLVNIADLSIDEDKVKYFGSLKELKDFNVGEMVEQEKDERFEER